MTAGSRWHPLLTAASFVSGSCGLSELPASGLKCQWQMLPSLCEKLGWKGLQLPGVLRSEAWGKVTDPDCLTLALLLHSAAISATVSSLLFFYFTNSTSLLTMKSIRRLERSLYWTCYCNSKEHYGRVPSGCL
jgi:hypothetical protein